VLLANQAAHRLLGFDDRSLHGEPIAPYLPALASALQFDHGPGSMRTMVEDRGLRLNGEVILTHIWFSTYKTKGGRRLAAIVLDVSEDLRDQEQGSLQSVMWTSQVLIGALHHESRNVCEALLGIHAKLSHDRLLAGNPDFQALGTLVDGLRQISSAHLGNRIEATPKAVVNPASVLEALRIIIEPSFRDKDAVIRWDIAERLPDVRGDHHSLLRVFMNLAQNSLRAMEGPSEKQLTISASQEDAERIVVRFRDTGAGVADSERLFNPFQPEAHGAGLGLFVSRALIRSLGGELHYEPQSAGALFAVNLALAARAEKRGQIALRKNPAVADRGSGTSARGPGAVAGG
jgi:signal transduction histidine kinase